MCSSRVLQPASGWEKGQVEKNVQDARPRLWQPMPKLPRPGGAERLAGAALHGAVARDPAWDLPGSIADVWAEEQAALMPLPPAFDGFVEQSKRVSPTCLISFERNRYSVPASFANRPVSLRIYPDRLVVAAEGQVLCQHERVIQRSPSPGRPARSTTGGTTWPSSSASRGRSAMARPSRSCPRPSGSCRI
jgi:hypothetical protein